MGAELVADARSAGREGTPGRRESRMGYRPADAGHAQRLSARTARSRRPDPCERAADAQHKPADIFPVGFCRRRLVRILESALIRGLSRPVAAAAIVLIALELVQTQARQRATEPRASQPDAASSAKGEAAIAAHADPD